MLNEVPAEENGPSIETRRAIAGDTAAKRDRRISSGKPCRDMIVEDDIGSEVEDGSTVVTCNQARRMVIT